MTTALEQLRILRTAKLSDTFSDQPESEEVISPQTSCVTVATAQVLPKEITEPVTIEVTFDAAISAVLQVLARAGQPVPHSQIINALRQRGYNKLAARRAIAKCQERGWIWHNLTTGFVLH